MSNYYAFDFSEKYGEAGKQMNTQQYTIGPKNPVPDKLHETLHSMDDQCLFALNAELRRLYVADVGMANIAWRIYGAIIYEAERREREQC